MVRLKTRSLLFQILYPDDPLKGNLIKVPFQQSSEAAVNVNLLLNLLRSQVQINFGDYGMGSVASTLAGTYP